MVIGELFLSAFLQVLFDRLASRELLHFALQQGVWSKLQKWEHTLQIIQAVLYDAEEKQLTERAVKIWLNNIRDLAYDVEDILDEFATEALHRNFKVQKNLVSASLTCFSPSVVNFNMSMGSKINVITSRLKELSKHRIELGLQIIPGGTFVHQRPPTTSVPTEPAVYGRDEDKKKILEMVSRNEPGDDANFHVMSIVGMAGLGKTTLARLVYNDKAVVEDFNRAWVCVSDDFDVFRISKEILEQITSSSCNLKNLNQVQVELQKTVSVRKFLLVLDDVWSRNYELWESLKSPFMAGAVGSKIIVTTRHGVVALTMGAVECYNLELLSDDACWSVFVMHAFERSDSGGYPNLELVREKVAEKCKGLPLAAKTLGGLLRSKKRRGEWEGILNSKIWNLPEEGGILPVLRLSYYHLPSHLKRCFAYCAIFPKGYEFEEDEVVLLWMAEGLLQQSENDKQLEDLGSEYFHDLVSRSIFQQANGDSSKFLMHDLVNDLAQWVSGETSFRLEETHKQPKRFQRARHCSYTSSYYDDKHKFEVFHEIEGLRTFLEVFIGDHRYPRYITNMVLSDLLPKLKKLRVLSLKRYHIIELPNSIGGLRHLRYLNFSGTKIRSLPESTTSLFNLQILLLKGCSCLMKLPSRMQNLVNLRHLDITGAKLIRNMPLGMKELKCLRTLSNFVVGKGTGSALKDLKNLKFLRGELCISRLENVTDLQGMGEVVLSDKKDLEVLLLQWGSQFDESQNDVVEQHVLDMLQPHRNLKELTIQNYGGTRFSSWVGDPSFSNMVVLIMDGCKNCTSLPPVGLLVSLRDLTIKNMPALKKIDHEIYGEGFSKPFQSLEALCFENLQEWECWDPIKEDDHVEIFPHLSKLFILGCPKLSGKLPGHLPSLETLVIDDCAQLAVSFSNLPMLCDIEISGCKQLVCSRPVESLKSMTLSNISEFGNWLQQGFQNVEDLHIVGYEELRKLFQNEICPEKPPQGTNSFISIKKLRIQDCSSLVSFPETSFISRLIVLTIYNCNPLTSLHEVMKHSNTCLQELRIKCCDSLAFIARGQLPSSLKHLEIRNCEKLQCLLEDTEDTCTPTSSSSSSMMHKEDINTTMCTSLLEYLHISDCPYLKSLSTRSKLPITVKHLEIQNCSRLTSLSSRGRLSEELEFLKIADCPKLESIAERFHNNTCLGEISLSSCENLKSIPEGLHNLNRLQTIHVLNCPSLVSFPEGGLPNNISSVRICQCEKLSALPNRLHSLGSLQHVRIWECPSIISFPEEGFPTSLTALEIVECPGIYKPLIEWGLHKLTSLKYLDIVGCPDAVSFPHEEMEMMLPTSLITLSIGRFPKLKCLSSRCFRSLTSLKYLWLSDCPKLKSFPKVGRPSSLFQLYIFNCPLLKKQCKRDKGQEWSKIAHIPCVYIDGKFIYVPEEDE